MRNSFCLCHYLINHLYIHPGSHNFPWCQTSSKINQIRLESEHEDPRLITVLPVGDIEDTGAIFRYLFSTMSHTTLGNE